MPANDRSPAGINVPAVSDWLAKNVEGFSGSARFDLIAGGRSNLTYRVTDDAGNQYALRRPPTGSVLESAHDMGREWKYVSAMQGTAVPVAAALAFCDDHDVTGADFYVMNFVDGIVLNNAAVSETLTPEARWRASEQAADVLAELHKIDITDLDVPGSRKTSGYIERQVQRWTQQVDATKPPETAQVDRISTLLLKDIPPQITGIAHGDFRLGNMSIAEDGTILAVFDWELATTGDTLADLGWMMSTWAEPGDTMAATVSSPTSVPGFMTRDQVAERYAQTSGHDISHLPYYVAFQRWRGACIQLGVRHRYEVGAMADDGYDHTELDDRIAASLDAAEEALS